MPLHCIFERSRYNVTDTGILSQLLSFTLRADHQAIIKNSFATLSFTAQGRSSGLYKRLVIGPEP